MAVANRFREALTSGRFRYVVEQSIYSLFIGQMCKRISHANDQIDGGSQVSSEQKQIVLYGLDGSPSGFVAQRLKKYRGAIDG